MLLARISSYLLLEPKRRDLGETCEGKNPYFLSRVALEALCNLTGCQDQQAVRLDRNSLVWLYLYSNDPNKLVVQHEAKATGDCRIFRGTAVPASFTEGECP